MSKMKNYKFSFYIIILLLLGSCLSDDKIDNTPKLGLLKSIEGSSDGNVSETTELSYNNDHLITTLKFTQGNYLIDMYNIEYNDDKVRSIATTSWDPQHADETSIALYDVTYLDNEIILTEQNSVNKMVFETTDGYVDSFKNYYGENINESVFKRDANNNIDSIFNYATNRFDTHLLIWNYAYSDFDANANFNSAYNPVFSYAYSLYRPLMGAVLNLKISKDTPLKSSFSDGHGTYIEENITAKMLEYEFGLLKNCSFQFHGSSGYYYLEFSYY